MNLEINFEIGEKLKNEISKNISEKDLKNIFDTIIKSLIEEGKKIDENLLKNKSTKTISLNFITNEEIQNLNKKSRGKDKATDCLSFPYEPEDFIPIFGEVFIAMPYIQKQAEEYGKSLKYEISKMFIHSILHLFGYDHQNDEEFKEMNFLEKKIMKKCFT